MTAEYADPPTEEIVDVIRRAVDVVLGDKAPTVTADDALGPEGIGIDSLGLIEVVMEIEEELGISFDSDELSGLPNIMALVDAIRAKMRAATSG